MVNLDLILEALGLSELPGWDQLQANNWVVMLVVGFVGLTVLRFLLRGLVGFALFRMRSVLFLFLAGALGGTPAAGLGSFDGAELWGSAQTVLCESARSLEDYLPFELSQSICRHH